jgi:hypothetical protein
MATKQYAAQISKRDLWMAAAELDMRDDSEQDVAKVCFLISAIGMSPVAAKREVAALHGSKPDTSMEKKIFSLMVPEKWLSDMIDTVSDLTPSELVRYSIAYVVDKSENVALENAKRKIGRPRKNTEAAS